jgi:adenine-specific DNA-methyltransferase
VDKPKFETPNITAKNVAKLAEIFPGVVSDGKVNFDLLRSLIGDEVFGDEAYEFTWVGKRDAIAEAGRPIRKTLRPCLEESKNWDTTVNLYIEGDNLEALKLLQESYLGKVKMIYIDPPYNTGNDFVYRDNFAQDKDEYDEEAGVYDEDGDRLFRNTESNGRYHSDWCSMMYPRLVLARNLLSNDGIIFISIDDNEVTQLRKICDEVFGEDNFFSQVIIQSNKRGQTYKQIAKTHEYLLIYTKQSESEFNELEKNGDNDDLNMQDDIGRFNIRELRNRNPKFGRHNRPNLFYSIFLNPNDVDEDGFMPVSLVKDNSFSVEVMPLNSAGQESCWRWGKEKLVKNSKKNTKTSEVVAKAKGTGGYNIYEKYRKTTYKPKSIWSETSIINEKGTVELGELGLASYFDFPKPIELLKRATFIGSNDNDIILDFFSGSATTAHAVMQLNAEDGGNRKYIMVQLPEPCPEGSEAAKAGYKNICEIGKERIRRAGEKIKADNADKEGIDDLDIGFRVLKLDDTNMKEVYYAAGEYTQDLLALMEDNIKEDRTDMDLLYACLLDWGLPLSMPHTQEKLDGFTVHTYNGGDLIACFDKNVSDAVVREIARRQPLRAVFRDNSFASSPAKINVEEIFKLLAPKTSVRVI